MFKPSPLRNVTNMSSNSGPILSPSEPDLPAYDILLTSLIAYKNRSITLSAMLADAEPRSTYKSAYGAVLAAQEYLALKNKHARFLANIQAGGNGHGVMGEEEESTFAMDPSMRGQDVALGEMERELVELEEGIRFLERVCEVHETRMERMEAEELIEYLRQQNLSDDQLRQVHLRWKQYMDVQQDLANEKSIKCDKLHNVGAVGDEAVRKLEKKKEEDGEEVATEVEKRNTKHKAWLEQEEMRFKALDELTDKNAELSRGWEKLTAIASLAYPEWMGEKSSKGCDTPDYSGSVAGERDEFESVDSEFYHSDAGLLDDADGEGDANVDEGKGASSLAKRG